MSAAGWAKVHGGEVVAVDHSGNAKGWPGWLPIIDQPPTFDPRTHGAGLPVLAVQQDRVVTVYTPRPLPATPPNMQDAVAAVDTTLIADPAVRTALEALKAAVCGKTKA